MFNIFSRKKKPGVTYYINVSQIQIPPSLLETGIKEDEYERKLEHYLNTGEFESTVYLAKNNTLLDGYSTYLIALQFNLGKIPVVYGGY